MSGRDTGVHDVRPMRGPLCPGGPSVHHVGPGAVAGGAGIHMEQGWHELHRTVVMPAHCDAYGHLNVRHYAAMFDEAGWHILPRSGVPLTALRSRGLGSVVATLTIDFLHELTAGQLVLVTGALTRVGRKSLGYEMRLYEADSMTHCATQKSVEVCFDTVRRVAAPWPDEIRATLTAELDKASR